MSKVSATYTDWHRVFSDFAYLGMTGDALAERIGLPTSLLQKVATGNHRPALGAAQRIGWLWTHLTGKPIEFLPRREAPAGAPRPEVPGLESNEERPLVPAQLNAVMFAWVEAGQRSR